MKIKNHVLNDPKVDIDTQSPNKSSNTMTPEIIVLHYTASGGEDGQGDATYLSRASSRASAHVVVGRNGDIHQIVPFNREAWHAGVSEYNNKSNVNDFSIGIEIDNWGWLSDSGLSHAGVRVPANEQFAGTRSGKNKWEAYKPKQLEAVEEVIAAITSAYKITDIVGHEEIAPGRKQDPGPALDEFMAKMKAKYLNAKEGKTNPEPKQGEKKAGPKTGTVAVTSLRLRQRPNTVSTILTGLTKGRKVTVLEDPVRSAPGWVKVQAGNRTGYVAKQYLTF